MAATTYTELVRRVPIWMMATNSTLMDEIDKVVLEAHNRLINILDHDLFKTTLSGLPVGVDGVLDLRDEDPAVLEVRAVRAPYKGVGMAPLLHRDNEVLYATYPISRPGLPRYYSEDGDPLLLRLWPRPHTALEVSVTANVEPPPLSPTVETNRISEEAPRALEKAVLHQAAMFMKEFETAQVYEQEMMAASAEVNAGIARHRRDETGVRSIDTGNKTGT